MNDKAAEKQAERFDLDICGDQYIYQENTLPRAAYDLTLYEHRILSVVASKMRPNDKEDQCYYFRIQDFAEYFGLTNVYDNLKDNLLLLRSRSFVVKRKDEPSSRITGWIREADIIPQTGIVQITIDPRVRPYFLEIKKALGYFRYKLDNVQSFTNSTAFRLYVRMKAEFKGKKSATLVMTIPEFRTWLNFKKEYKRYADLKRRIIIPAVEDINGVEGGKRKGSGKRSDISINFVEIFESRKITGVMFKATLISDSNDEEDPADIPEGLIQEDGTQTIETYFTNGGFAVPDNETKDAINYFLSLKIERKIIRKAAETFGLENIKKIAEYVKNKAPKITKSIAGYAISALEGGYGIIKTEIPVAAAEKQTTDKAPKEIHPADHDEEILHDIERSKKEQDDLAVETYIQEINEDKIDKLITDCEKALANNTFKSALFRRQDALTHNPSKMLFYTYIRENVLGLE